MSPAHHGQLRRLDAVDRRAVRVGPRNADSAERHESQQQRDSPPLHSLTPSSLWTDVGEKEMRARGSRVLAKKAERRKRRDPIGRLNDETRGAVERTDGRAAAGDVEQP